jgi:dienelactone hydrolase
MPQSRLEGVLPLALLGLLAWALGYIIDVRDRAPALPPGVEVTDVRIAGPAARYTIAMRIVRPTGGGPFGGIVLNHGVAASERDRRRESPDLLMSTAVLLAQRGYAVLMPLRRGFGATGGPFLEHAGSCERPDYRGAERAAADDIMAAYHYARSLPYVDGARIILAGQSAGGVAAIYAAAAHAPEGLVAVLAFAAGRGGDPTRRPGEPCSPDALAALFEEFGREVRVPVLFHYARNDLFFGPKVTRAWYERFAAAGARAEYVLQPDFGADGHYLLSDAEGVRYWMPAVERFFARHRVPFNPSAWQVNGRAG